MHKAKGMCQGFSDPLCIFTFPVPIFGLLVNIISLANINLCFFFLVSSTEYQLHQSMYIYIFVIFFYFKSTSNTIFLSIICKNVRCTAYPFFFILKDVKAFIVVSWTCNVYTPSTSGIWNHLLWLQGIGSFSNSVYSSCPCHIYSVLSYSRCCFSIFPSSTLKTESLAWHICCSENALYFSQYASGRDYKQPGHR